MNPEIAIQKLKKMILEDKVEAVFQQSSSTVGFAITQTIPRYKKLFICQGASSMDFTGAKFNPYMFHTTANSVQYIRGQAAYLGKERKYKKISSSASTTPSDTRWRCCTKSSSRRPRRMSRSWAGVLPRLYKGFCPLYQQDKGIGGRLRLFKQLGDGPRAAPQTVEDHGIDHAHRGNADRRRDHPAHRG